MYSRLLRIFLLVLALASISGPRIVYAEESSGTWRGKWWNYYERGVSRGDDGNWEAARSDLSKALDLRDKDQRRARTYGMHFIDYFPHRELGVAYYHLGDLKRALSELEISHASAESAKASFYLNAIRRKQLLQHGSQPRIPDITVSFPTPDQAVRDAAIVVSGRVQADGHVASVRINGKPYRFDLATQNRDFSLEVPLDDEDSMITVEATDLLGKTTRREIPVVIDREGPSLSLTAISRAAEDRNRIRINARLTDVSGIKALIINGVTIQTGNRRELELDTVATLPVGTSQVRIEATDMLGNQTTVDLEPDRNRAALLWSGPLVLLASSGPGIFSSDKEQPVISLKDNEDLPAVYIDRYYVEGEAFDNSKVERITVNGKEIQIAKGKKVFFSKMVKLKEGGNKITVEATDGSGNKTASNFNVKRIVPSARQNSARMSLSVLPFNGRIKNTTVQDMADDFLVAALVDQKRFQIVEREKLKQILQEQKLSKEHLTDPEHSIQVGKLLSADAILATTIAEGQKSLEIITRLVSSETAEVMETKDVYIEDKSLAAVKELMEGLASKLTLGFPVVEGIVVKREKGTLFSDLGSSSGVRKSMTASVYRRGKEIRHPTTGKSLGWDMVKIGDGTIDDVQDGFSKVHLHDKVKGQQDIQARDIIITR
ncbi:MAG: hypothetical protein IPQ16_13740 [Geobacteraceae bacterium]|nr:hypothetical protein [Geobacteraceae bacterium]